MNQFELLTVDRVQQLRIDLLESMRRPTHIPEGEWTQGRGMVALCEYWLDAHAQPEPKSAVDHE